MKNIKTKWSNKSIKSRLGWLLCGITSFVFAAFVFLYQPAPVVADYAPDEFVTTWKTDNPGGSGSANNQILLMTNHDYEYNYHVAWERVGNPSINGSAGPFTSQTIITFPSPGIYEVRITGDFPALYFGEGGVGTGVQKLLTVEQWGTNPWATMEGAFYFATNLQIPAPDAPNLSNVTNMTAMFAGATSFNSNINHWDVSNVNDMSGMFFLASSFNQPLNNWDVSNVTSMTAMFQGAFVFNQSLNSWDTNSVDSMFALFAAALAFNQPLNNWDVSNVSGMGNMFYNAVSFNQPLGAWDVSNVTSMTAMFQGAMSFNQPLSGWDVSSVTDMSEMFSETNEYSAAPLSTENYDATLIAWSQLALQDGVHLGAGSATYCDASAHRSLISSTYGWVINDGGSACVYAPDEFVTIWKTDNPGVSSDNQVTIPAVGDSHNYAVDWGDGNSSSGYTGQATHTYDEPGLYTIKITGDFPQMSFGSGGGDEEKILAVEQWGTNHWASMAEMFRGASHLQIPAADAPDLSNVSSMELMFEGASSFNSNINHWDTSNVVDMHGVFKAATSFNQPLNSWDVGNVSTMSSMFNGATSFNQPLNNWITSNVGEMQHMFQEASSFNSDISNWDTSSVHSMYSMFSEATSFNQPLNSWDVSNILNMNQMFLGATSFNQPLSNWDVSNVEDMSMMFGNFDEMVESAMGETPYEDWPQEVQGMYGLPESGLSTANYDATLIAWSALTLQDGVMFDAGSSTYCAAAGERQSMIDTFSWTITDSGENCGYAPDEFVTTWKTDNPGITANNQIRIPTTGGGYNYSIEWQEVGNPGNNGTAGPFTGQATLTFPSAGTYEVKITGSFPRIYFNSGGDIHKILTVEQWGTNQWASMDRAFSGASNLQILAIDAPDLSGVTSMYGMFLNTTSFNSNINHWDVSNITNMQLLFAGTSSFNQPLDNWDTSNVVSMDSMFRSANAFNQPLDDWDVSSVVSMSSMFEFAALFNQPLNSWETTGLEHATYMFSYTPSFNQPLNNWDMSNIINMNYMFYNAGAFNQPLDDWDVSNVTSLLGVFDEATSFNQSLGTWDVSGVINMTYIFSNTSISVENYDDTLMGWSNLDLQPNVPFYTYPAQYCLSESVRQDMIDTLNWNIWDSGKSPSCNANPEDAFITTWKTDNPGESNDNQITIPTTWGGGDNHNYLVEWEEIGNPGNSGTAGPFVTSLSPTITFPSAGVYEVRIIGYFPRLFFGGFDDGDREKILTVEQWGTNQWTSMSAAFMGATNLQIPATDAPDLSNVTDMSSMFRDATSFNSDISHWDVSNVTSMSAMFYIENGVSSFNQSLDTWDVSSVANMSYMLFGTALSTENYDATLTAWSQLELQSNVQLYAFPTQFCDSVDQRQHIINTFNWTILDGGNACAEPVENTPFVTITSPEDEAELQTGSNTINGIGPRNQEIEILLDDDVVGMTTVNGDGEWTYNLNVPSTGSYTLDARWTPSDDIAFVSYLTMDYSSSGVQVIDTTSHTVLKTIDTASFGLAVSVVPSSDKTKLYIPLINMPAFQGSLLEIDLATMTTRYLSNISDPGEMVYRVTLAPDGSRAYMLVSSSGGNHTVRVIDLTTDDMEVVENISHSSNENSGSLPPNISINEAGTQLYITGLEINAVVDLPTSSVVPLVLGADPQPGLTNFAIRGDTGYAVTRDCQLLIIDLASNTVTREILIEACEYGSVVLAVNAAQQVAYIVAPEELSVIDLQTEEETLLANYSHRTVSGAALSSDASQLYIPSMNTGLAIWDTQSNQWVDDAEELLPSGVAAYSLGDKFVSTMAPVSDQISFSVTGESEDPDAFITTWKTDNPGESNDNQITIPTTGGGYNYSVTWEEVGNPDNSGTVGPFTSGATITFPSAGIYKISITGDFPRIYLNGVGDTQKILTVEQWGSSQWNSMEAAFYGASNLVITAIDAPDLSNVTDMTAMFISATSFNSDINHWDTSNVNNMASMFRDTSFNQPLDNWDVSNVTDMGGLFDNTPFNQDIDSWDVSNVTNMWSMFANTSSFNQPLSSWNTSSVVDMSRMFDSASSFNQPLDNWNVSGVEYMNSMLYNTGLSTENYDATLAAWSTLELQSNVSFTAFPTQYCDAAEERQHIINTFNWTIQDGGNACAEASENDPFVTIASPEDGVELEAGSNAITGTGPRNQEIEILLDDDVVGTTIVNGDGDWTYSLNVPSTGSYTLDARWTPGGDIAFVPYMDIGEMSSAIRVIDTETQEVIKNIALPAGAAPLSVTLNHAKTKLYAVGAELLSMQSRVWEIDLDTMNINQQIGLDMLALQVAVSPDDTVVYVLSSDMDSSSHIQQYDASTNLTPIGEPVSIAGVLGVEASFTLNEAGTKLYLTKIQDLESSPYMFTDAVIDTATGTLTLLDWVSGYSYAATSFTIANNVGYATVMDNNGCRVLVIDISTDAITQTINVPGCVPVLLSATVVDGSAQKLYMTAADGLYVVDIQDQTSSLLTTLPDGYSYGASLTSDGTQLYLVGSDGYTENILVRIWDTQTNEWIDDGSGGLLPAGVAGYSLGSNFVSPMAPVGDQISFSVTGESEDPDAFITTWKTDNPGESSDNQIIIPTHPDENYNYTVEWEEVGNPDNNGTAGPFTGDGTITFPSAGTYKISITGDFPRIFFSVNDSDPEKILTVEQWGTNQWSSMGGAFSGAINLQIPATDAPDLSNVTDMNSMFSGATSFNSNINNWDVSGITDMYSMFRDATSFNQPLNSWDTSSVTNMREMFSHATSFNQPIGSWDIMSVNDIYLMFWHASSFNQPLDDWDVSGLTDLGSVFLDATSFNQPLNNWDVSGITGMASTFSGASSFNQPLDNWDVSNVVLMNNMFSWASSFNQPLNSWDVSSAVNMNNMFAAAESFNQPLNSWDVRNVQEMGAMFANTISFNQPLDNWDVSGATSMYQMFSISAFDQSLASWDVSNVEDMFMMFGNLDAVIEEYMDGIPYEDWPQQYQDLYGLPASGLSTENYDATLTAWSQLTLQDDVTFDAGTSTYCDATSQRQSIIDTFAWTINDSGENCEDEEEPTDPETPGGSTPPTRPTTPPSTVTPDEPPVVPGEGEQSGVVEERTAEDDDEAAVVRDEDGLESEPGGGSTTPRRPGGEAVQGRENFVARTLDGVASFFGVSPIAVAQAFPWLLIILLLLLALVTAIKVIQQLLVIAKTRKLVARQVLLNHEKKSLISLATHYLRTPLTILSSGIEMLPAESTARQAISKATAGLKTTIDELIGQIETNKNLVNLAEPSKPLHRRTSLLQPAIFVPTLLTLGLVLGANILVAVATTFDPGWQHIGAQIVGVLIVGGLFYVAYDHHRQKKTLQAYEQQLLKHEEGLDVARNQFVKGMADTLVPAVVAVDTAVPAGLPEDTTKFLKEGLRQLEHTVGDFILIGQLEKQVLQQRATSVAVRDTVSRAQQQLEQSDAQLSVNVPADTTVHQPQFLLHKVFGSLIDNAVAHNKPNTPAEVTSKQGKAITAIEVTDYGEGIPEDKLSLLFKPLSRVQTAEDFTHQGIGLSLYMSRLIMHYLGGDISAASKVGKGTTMQVKVPNQMEV